MERSDKHFALRRNSTGALRHWRGSLLRQGGFEFLEVFPELLRLEIRSRLNILEQLIESRAQDGLLLPPQGNEQPLEAKHNSFGPPRQLRWGELRVGERLMA